MGPNGADFATLTEAVASVSSGGQGVFVVAPNTGDTPYVASHTIDESKTIALLADSGRPVLQGTAGNPTLTVAANTTVLLAGLNLTLNGSAVGISVAGQLALDAVEARLNTAGGILASSSAELLVRNSVVAGNGNNTAAIALGGGSLELLYSSVGGGDSGANPTPAIDCGSGHQLTVRNSILISLGTGETLAGCTPTITYSAVDAATAPAGAGNVTFAPGAPLFEDLSTGDLRLTATGATLFDGVAQWLSGDPPSDLDGQPRPTADASPDTAGAHLGPGGPG